MESLPEIEIEETFELAYRFVTETQENIFLTGKAGTGKTTFLKYLKNNCNKNMVVAAPTGVAAINAGGVTLHSLFHLPFYPLLPIHTEQEALLARLRLNRNQQRLLQAMELLVIDEVSMVRCDILDAIDTILKSVRRRHDLPFGGVQLLCIGDLYQLPPVALRDEWALLREHYDSPYFFDSLCIREQYPVLIELTKIYRQKDDSFVYLLNKIRNNQVEPEDYELLHSRWIPDFRPGPDDNYITLTSHNRQADEINIRELGHLLTEPFTYHGIVENEFPEKNYPADPSLVLKRGAQVMFLKNDPVEKKYFNGKIGVVSRLDEDEVVVSCGEEEITVQKETWENYRYIMNREDGKMEQELMGTYTQFPLRLAWAITIHKSQGLTFENIVINAEKAFAGGQVYVALSRCTHLEGIILLNKIPPQAISTDETVVRANQQLSPKGSLAERFAGARQLFTHQILEQIFSFEECAAQVELLSQSVLQHTAQLNPEASSWIAGLLNDVNIQKEIGMNFMRQVGALLNEEKVIEQNTLLQERLKAASTHFSPKVGDWLTQIKQHPLVTEHKQAATVLDNHLNEVYLTLHLLKYQIDYCRKPFALQEFLKYRLNYVSPRQGLTCYAAAKDNIASHDAGGDGDPIATGLIELLFQWRNQICNERQIPVYMVANKDSLTEIATYLPTNKKELQKLKGFGPAKVHQYGDDILDIVHDYCSRNNLESNMAAKEPAPKRKRKERSVEAKTPTKIISFTLFKEGKSITEIAKERNFSINTIEGHLASFVASKEIGIDELVPIEKQKLITEAAKKYGKESFKNLKENLPDDISYGEIRMVMTVVE